MARAPEATEFEEMRSSILCRNCGRVSASKDYCDYCEFPLATESMEPVDPRDLVGNQGEVTIFTPPTPDPEGVDPGSHGGML